jgi:hypothetical protein
VTSKIDNLEDPPVNIQKGRARPTSHGDSSASALRALGEFDVVYSVEDGGIEEFLLYEETSPNRDSGH